MTKLHHATLDGAKIAYSDETVFIVQVGRYRNKYKTRYWFKGSLTQAVIYYKSLNIGNGYKKRLVAPSMNRPVLARYLSDY